MTNMYNIRKQFTFRKGKIDERTKPLCFRKEKIFISSKASNYNTNEKALRETQTLRRAGCSKVRSQPARPPARSLSQTHRQDRLQYTAPQLASAQCKHNKQSQNSGIRVCLPQSR